MESLNNNMESNIKDWEINLARKLIHQKKKRIPEAALKAFIKIAQKSGTRKTTKLYSFRGIFRIDRALYNRTVQLRNLGLIKRKGYRYCLTDMGVGFWLKVQNNDLKHRQSLLMDFEGVMGE